MHRQQESWQQWVWYYWKIAAVCTLTGITCPTKDLAFYDESQAAWILEKGEYLLRVGSYSRNTKIVARIQLARTVTVEGVIYPITLAQLQACTIRVLQVIKELV